MEQLTTEKLKNTIQSEAAKEFDNYSKFVYGDFIVEVWSLEGEGNFELNINAPLTIESVSKDTNQLGNVEEANDLIDLLNDCLVELNIIPSSTSQGYYLIDTIDEIDPHNYYSSHSLEL